MEPDLHYVRNGIWTKFFPNTPNGEAAWIAMEEQGGAVCLTAHEKNVIAQLNAAGYTVKKSPKSKVSDIERIQQELDELLGG